MVDGSRDSERPGMRGWGRSTRLDAAYHLVAALDQKVAGVAGGDQKQLRCPRGCITGKKQEAIEALKGSLRTGSSPGVRRCRQFVQRWPEELGMVGNGGAPRRCWGRRRRPRRLGASRVDSFVGKMDGEVAELRSITASLGETSFAGDSSEKPS